jgi:hypothetical protein
MFTENVQNVYTRLAFYNGALYLDLGTLSREVVEITEDGWKVSAKAPVYFRRPESLLPLPHPVHGGDLDRDLRPLLNVDDAGFTLTKAFLVGCFLPHGAVSHLILEALAGSSKTMYTTVVKTCIDPSTAPTRKLPDKTDDLIIAARNNLVLAYDNVSSISADMSDALCRLATGEGWGTRRFYTNFDEVVISVKRPVILNGIGTFVKREDLAQRCLFVDLPPIVQYRSEQHIWEEFRANHPRILGAILDAVVLALGHGQTDMNITRYRMADFVRWVEASGIAPDFQAVYATNRMDALEIALDGEAIGPWLKRYLEHKTELRGTTEEIGAKLKNYVNADCNAASPVDWPKTPHAFGTALKRLTPTLKELGYEVRRSKKRGGDIVITRVTC